MNTRELGRSMYELRNPSIPQRLTMAGFVGLWVVAVWWLLFGGGVAIVGGWFHWVLSPGNPLRRACLAIALSIYYVRILFTEFVFLKRGVSWSEALSIVPWLLCIYLLLAILGGTNTAAFAITGATGVVLFVVGSWMNSFAEYKRHVWKQRPENRGRLYTEGLFRYSRHPNYLGDLLSFSGLCLISGSRWSALIPGLMLCGFVFVNVPVLDSHLREKYGVAFDEYASRSWKLIPFVY